MHTWTSFFIWKRPIETKFLNLFIAKVKFWKRKRKEWDSIWIGVYGRFNVATCYLCFHLCFQHCQLQTACNKETESCPILVVALSTFGEFVRSFSDPLALVDREWLIGTETFLNIVSIRMLNNSSGFQVFFQNEQRGNFYERAIFSYRKTAEKAE